MADDELAALPASTTCDNIRHFKEFLKNLRLLDDKIIYKLNTSVPTESFKHEVDAEQKCRQLHNKLLEIYKIREDSIKNCIAARNKNLEELKKKSLQKEDESSSLQKEMRSEQHAIRLMQSELMVEEVIKSRSVKVFKERCWKVYTPPNDL